MDSITFLLDLIETDSCWMETSLESHFIFIICDHDRGLTFVLAIWSFSKIVCFFAACLAQNLKCLVIVVTTELCGFLLCDECLSSLFV